MGGGLPIRIGDRGEIADDGRHRGSRREIADSLGPGAELPTWPRFMTDRCDITHVFESVTATMYVL